MAAFRCNLNQCSVSFGHTVCLSVKQKTIYWAEFFFMEQSTRFYALFFSAFACLIQFPATNCIKHHVLLICFVLFFWYISVYTLFVDFLSSMNQLIGCAYIYCNYKAIAPSITRFKRKLHTK